MPSEYVARRQVEFSDTDMAGIVHFSNFFRFMESAEHEFVRSLGHSLHEEVEGRMLGFARVHAECDYLAPLRYPERFSVRVTVVGKRASTVSYRFRFERDDGELAARGALTVCCVTRDPGAERIRPVPLPAALAAALEVAPDAGAADAPPPGA